MARPKRRKRAERPFHPSHPRAHQKRNALYPPSHARINLLDRLFRRDLHPRRVCAPSEEIKRTTRSDFRALKNPRPSSRPLKTRSERIHARRRCQTMRKRDDNIGYKDDTLHILTVLTKICMFGCKANLFVERRRGCVNSHFCNFVLRRKKRERAVSRVA